MGQERCSSGPGVTVILEEGKVIVGQDKQIKLPEVVGMELAFPGRPKGKDKIL